MIQQRERRAAFHGLLFQQRADERIELDSLLREGGTHPLHSSLMYCAVRSL